MSLSYLTSLELTTTEISLYELLLRLGELPVGDVIRESQLKRPTVYKALYSLEKKKLVEKREFNKKIHFRPESPVVLLKQAEEKYQEVAQARHVLQTIAPKLLSDYTFSVERPVVKIYEGIDGVMKAHFEILHEHKEILAFVAINEEIDAKLTKFWPKYYAYRKANNIFAKVITPNTKEALGYKQNDVSELRETRLVPYEKFPMHLEKNICGNKVAFFAMTEQKDLIATVIENPIIAEAEKAGFLLAWEQAKHYNESLTKPPRH